VKSVPRASLSRQKTASYVFILSGMGILVWTLWPIISFTTLKEDALAKTVSPVSDTVYAAENTLPAIIDTTNYEDPNSWYPTKPQKKITAAVNSYALTIPKLKIQNATVMIAGDDLAESLVHYGGTPMPGQYGNTVIFGHSTLPQFYNPTNYKTIFSLLPTLQVGDTVIVSYDGITYTYRVYSMIVVEPTDLSPLEQKFDDSYMTLVTCVPPGTYWKRLNVKLRLTHTI